MIVIVGIIILNYINWDVTINCINSVYKTTKNIHYHIYLIDNASPNFPPDEILELVKHKDITFIKNRENKGYSAGNNVGIKKAIEDGCEAILIANSDIVFSQDSILKMFDYLKDNLNVGIVGPKLLDLNGRIQTPSMCIKTGLKEKYMVRTGLRNIFKSASRKYYCYNTGLRKPLLVHSVSGSCFMMSQKCALDITPFDESTFLFEEELILGIQMEQLGYETIYYPECYVIHAHGQSTKSIKAFSFICFVESEIYYCKKYIKANLIEILPLYLIRTISYLYRCFKYYDFRKNLSNYFVKTIRKLSEKYN